MANSAHEMVKKNAQDYL